MNSIESDHFLLTIYQRFRNLYWEKSTHILIHMYALPFFLSKVQERTKIGKKSAKQYLYKYEIGLVKI